MNINKLGSNIVNSCIKSANDYVTPSISYIKRTPLKEINLEGLRYAPHKADIIQECEKLKFEKMLRTDYSSEQIKISINGEEAVWSRFRGSQMGSQDAFWAKNEKTGGLYYVKYAQDAEKEGHIESEILASKLYRLAGIDAPEVVPITINGNIKGLASRYVPNLEPLSGNSNKLYEGFAADAWLANWDSLLHGNTFLRNGHSFKIDNGGALRYRAQGKLKPNFGDKVDELTTLVDGRNWTSTEIYSSMTQEDLIKSFEKVCNISDKAIIDTVADKELAQTLINRRNYMNAVLAEIKETPKTERSLEGYLSRVTQQASEKLVFNSETLSEILSKRLNSAIIEDKNNSIIMPPSKSVANNLIEELKTIEGRGVKISQDEITSFLREVAEDGLDIRAPKDKANLMKLCAMEEFYTRMFFNLSKIAEKTPMKDGETASSYVTRLTKLRAKKLKQIEALRIKTIKSKLKYEADSPAPSRPLTPKERAQAIKELQAQRRRDIECEIKDTLPKIPEDASDAFIHKCWQKAHLGNFKFSSDELQDAVMQTGRRYNSSHPIKTKCGGGQDIAEKDYVSEFEFEPVYHWIKKKDAEKFVTRDLPKVGEVYTVPRRQCCSTHKTYAEFDYGDHLPALNVKFIMHPKSETSRAYNTGYNQEVVYRAGEQFRILDKECVECIDPHTGEGYLRWEVHMQEV